jgi:hypothetical protein
MVFDIIIYMTITQLENARMFRPSSQISDKREQRKPSSSDRVTIKYAKRNCEAG